MDNSADVAVTGGLDVTTPHGLIHTVDLQLPASNVYPPPRAHEAGTGWQGVAGRMKVGVEAQSAASGELLLVRIKG